MFIPGLSHRPRARSPPSAPTSSTTSPYEPSTAELPPLPPAPPPPLAISTEPIAPRSSSPATPPPTPLSSSLLCPAPLSSSDLMLELTRAKLERAAQGQLTGRRAAGLRELVLLSNAFVGALPDWTRRDQREREVLEQRKLEEERWLDGILEEMSVEDEEDEEEAYVELSFRDERPAYDSGFLDQDAAHKASTSASTFASTSTLDGSELVDSVDSLEEDYREGRAQGGAELDPIEEEDEVSPKPSKSPPIAVPLSPTRAQAIVEEACEACSPPFDPPPLTPDASPHDRTGSILGSSLDSFEAHHRLTLDRIDWLRQPVASKRPGLLSIDTATSSLLRRSHSTDLEFESLSLSLHSSSVQSHDGTQEAIADPDLQLALVPRSASASPSAQWASPPPTRSVSLPPLTRAPSSDTTPPVIPSFTSGVVTLWDCVDFGKMPPPIPYFAPAPRTNRGRLTDGTSGLLERRSLPSFPPLAGEDGARVGRSPWRARSTSPESGQRQVTTFSTLAELDCA